MNNGNTLTRITEEVRALAEAGAPGERLPSVRELMSRYGAGPATVQKALSKLVGEGLVEARPGRGSFVAPRVGVVRAGGDLGWQAVALGERTVSAEGLEELLAVPEAGGIPLTAGYLPEDLQPTALLAGAMARAARRPGSWGRIPVEGIEGLRSFLAREVGGPLRGRDVVVTSGGQAALSVAFRALAAPGSPVLMESPTYVGAIAAARAAGLRPVPVPTDEGGVRLDMLKEAFARSGARLFYCQPTYANPHGAVLAAARRGEVLAVAREAGAFLIEDDWARDFALDGQVSPPLAADDPDGRVVYVRSLTKSLAPGMRVAALCARGAAGERLRAARIVGDFFVSGPLQEAALEVLSSPGWRRHLGRLRRVLRERRDALVPLVREHLPQAELALVPAGGLHLWVRLPDDLDDVGVAARALEAGVVVSAGRRWFPAEPPGSFLRLSYIGAEPEA